jgi:hypothetical protein
MPDGRTFLEDDDPGEVAAAAGVFWVPEEDGGDAAFVVHLPVGVEGLVGLDFELAHLRGGHGAVIDGWIIFIRPRRPRGQPYPSIHKDHSSNRSERITKTNAHAAPRKSQKTRQRACAVTDIDERR